MDQTKVLQHLSDVPKSFGPILYAPEMLIARLFVVGIRSDVRFPRIIRVILHAIDVVIDQAFEKLSRTALRSWPLPYIPQLVLRVLHIRDEGDVRHTFFNFGTKIQ